MKIALKNEHGYLSAQPVAADGTVPFQYRDAVGAWETFEVVELDAPAPVPPDPTPPTPDPGPNPDDAIDLSHAIVASDDCPPVAHLAVLTQMQTITLTQAEQGYAMTFPGRDTWPGVVPPGWEGPINHTLWMAEYIGGLWYVLPIKEALGDYCTLGPILQHGQVPENLTYFAREPMLGYQPALGELVGFFVTTGDTRRMNVQPLGFVGRSNVVLVPFTAGTYTW
jgi:hypothetical protein